MSNKKNEKKYNREVFNEMKTALGLSNYDLSVIVGLKAGTVKNQVSPYSEKVSTWMRAFIFMYERQKQLQDEIKQTDALNRKLIRDYKNAIVRKSNKVKITEEEEA